MSIESILSPPWGACQSPRALDSRARAMDGAVHTAAAKERRVRRVHDGVHLLLGDVALNECDSRRNHCALRRCEPAKTGAKGDKLPRTRSFSLPGPFGFLEWKPLFDCFEQELRLGFIQIETEAMGARTVIK